MRIINTKYNLDNIKTNIVLISDIHYYSKNDIKHLNKILDNIKSINPKYICITGDFIDEHNIKDEECFIDWLNKLSNISKVIISIGNHEFYKNKKEGIFKLDKVLLNKIKKINNLYLLDNTSIILDNINFIGITLPIEYYMNEINKNIDFTKYFKNIKTNNNYYNVLLCHSPINICDEKIINLLNVDLILCGHTHGGVTPKILRPIFKNNGLISPNRKLFPKNVYGKLKIKNTYIIITSGITIISHINKYRILKKLFASEIVNINTI